MPDGVPYDRVLEVRQREVGVRQVLSNRARSPGALGRELVDDPRLRVVTRFRHAARYARVAPVEREVQPHALLDDHVVLPAVEHHVASHDHTPQLSGIRDRCAFRLQWIALWTGRVSVQKGLAVYRESLDPGTDLVPGYEPECPWGTAHVVHHSLGRIEALELRTACKLAGLLPEPSPDGQAPRPGELFHSYVLQGRAEVGDGNECRLRFGSVGAFRRFTGIFGSGATGLPCKHRAGSLALIGSLTLAGLFRTLGGARDQ